MTVRERPAFIADGRLYSVLCTGERADAAVLVVTGFGEEKKSSARNVVELCRALAGSGVVTLRFDLRGTGDSDFPFSEVSLGHWLDDVRDASEALRVETGSVDVALLGVRLGCLVGAAADANFTRAVLVAPVASGAAWLREELMRKQLRAVRTGRPRLSLPAMEELLASEGTLDLDGIRFPRRLAEELKALGYPSSIGFPAKVISVGPGSNPAPEAAKAAQALGAVTPEHFSYPPFWNQTDHARTDWLTGSVLSALELH
jgi:alpha-beta hydrolase superfamily lysophospholipase